MALTVKQTIPGSRPRSGYATTVPTRSGRSPAKSTQTVLHPTLSTGMRQKGQFTGRRASSRKDSLGGLKRTIV